MQDKNISGPSTINIKLPLSFVKSQSKIQATHTRHPFIAASKFDSTHTSRRTTLETMYAFIIALALSTLSSALPLWDPPACKYHPQTFSINQLSIFTPTNSNPSPYKTISFDYSVTTTGSNGPATFGTTCIHTGLDVLNPGYPFYCRNGHFTWVWNGKSLTVGEDYYSPCNNV